VNTQENYLRTSRHTLDFVCCVQTIHGGHYQIEDYEVWVQLQNTIGRLLTVAYDLQLILGQNRAKVAPRGGVVIGH